MYFLNEEEQEGMYFYYAEMDLIQREYVMYKNQDRIMERYNPDFRIERVSVNAKQQIEEMGLPELLWDFSNYSGLRFYSTDEKNPLGPILEKILILETNQEDIEKIKNIQTRYNQMLEDLGESEILSATLKGNEIYLYEKRLFSGASSLQLEEKRKRVDLLVNKEKEVETLSKLKKIQMGLVFGNDIDDRLIDKKFEDYWNEEMNQIKRIKVYLNQKLDEIKKEIDEEIEEILSFEAVDNFLMSYPNVAFDWEGKALF